MILRRFNLLCLLYNVLLKGYSVKGFPYLILSSTRSKCFSVIAPHQQTITIDYDAPDLQGPVETLASATKKNEPTEDEKAKYDNEGLDTQWNKRMKERLERIKTKKAARYEHYNFSERNLTRRPWRYGKQSTVTI